ncbi:hypothetical protein AB0O31_14860 [Kitasatospora cineracea]|uniref:hypothetical protein n=1 Tax=Kitasatospora cineracea TaxID=88074 RepID=UPI003429C6EC
MFELTTEGQLRAAAELLLVGPSCQPFGGAALLAEVCARRDGLESRGRFGWMQRAATGFPPLDGGTGVAHWLAPGELDGAVELIDRHFPASHAHPHRSGVRDGVGRLTVLAADAWPALAVGLLAGVVGDPVHGRGRRLPPGARRDPRALAARGADRWATGTRRRSGSTGGSASSAGAWARRRSVGPTRRRRGAEGWEAGASEVAGAVAESAALSR